MNPDVDSAQTAAPGELFQGQQVAEALGIDPDDCAQTVAPGEVVVQGHIIAETVSLRGPATAARPVRGDSLLGVELQGYVITRVLSDALSTFRRSPRGADKSARGPGSPR